jgi:hypothetical protein
MTGHCTNVFASVAPTDYGLGPVQLANGDLGNAQQS